MKIDIIPSDFATTDSVSNESRVNIPSELLKDVAAKSHGMVGADLLRLLKEAAYLMCKRIGCNLPATLLASRKGGDSYVSTNLEKEFESLSIGAAVESNDTTTNDNMDDSNTSVQSIPVILPTSPPNLMISSLDVATALSRTSPSALREVVIEVPTVRWTDIGGMDQVKQSLIEVLTHSKSFICLSILTFLRRWLSGRCVDPSCSKVLASLHRGVCCFTALPAAPRLSWPKHSPLRAR